jgi:5-methylcytosine-specific restriction enzyme A
VAWERWYHSARWARIRRCQLSEHPLCKYCLEVGRVSVATVCDHVERHGGDVNRFWLGPFQSLCKPCHDSTKRHIELHGYRPDIGLDGYPLDPRHPCYARDR